MRASQVSVQSGNGMDRGDMGDMERGSVATVGGLQSASARGSGSNSPILSGTASRNRSLRKSSKKGLRTGFKDRPTKMSIDNNLQIKTGASLIPDLNLIINRMRNMKDDSYVYLDYMLPKDSEYFTPYSLREVQFANLNILKPYYTVTRHGVTYWRVSENFFTPLNQWQQEFQQFLSIIQIRTFSIFRLWKGFKVWEKTIKWRKLNAARNHLQNNLFIVIPQLAKAILRMRSDIVVLERLSFINIENIEEWHPFYFLELHMRIYEQLNYLFMNSARTWAELYVSSIYHTLSATKNFTDTLQYSYNI